MKIKTKSGITENLDFDCIADELQHKALERDYYFTGYDIYYLMEDIKKEMNKFLKEDEIISIYDLQYIIRLVLMRSKFKWICSDIYV